ncbi:threonine--tRNA ligase [Paenibacillus silvae]|uniref:threonine--tRNA ligase n=1 Tax=Paenibacillus silvae TaxID=1325358 RepID=UPI00200561CC|nr:threonine--tRNA ligase [Paenibacillus silvae]MCK6074745.1 threonine--tRNA ligase [Paenibacillus silvae]MCK6147780.1 threonine--tRNA ligase [Paenibacillus silvae]MCK6266078.1 threonine--tRNA ligase [Paenibacillus silvae]
MSQENKQKFENNTVSPGNPQSEVPAALIEVRLQGGDIRSYYAGTTVGEIASSISTSLGKQAIGGIVNDRHVDLSEKLEKSCELIIVTLDSEQGVYRYRHSTAHVLAQALKRLYGADQVKLGIGPVIEDGFYYDVDLEQSLSISDLEAIEREMNKIIQENLPIHRKVVSRAQAVELFEAIQDPYKLELIRDLPEDAELSIYEQGEFFDLCRGPHLPSTGRIKAFKLLNVAGAYWRGNSDNKMMQRIYGTAFPNKAQLEQHLHLLEEAKKRDHRKLGKELELFMFSEEAPGMPFYLPKGMTVRTELEQFSRELQLQEGYQEVRTPLMMNNRLWEQSGHWEHYKDNMYFADVDDATFALKPMNCPGHMLIFKNTLHSYRELPIRMMEFGQVHRHEYSGALNGMMRVRTFCQDDAHLYVMPKQIEEEINRAISLIGRMYDIFGFDYKIELSTRPEDSMGSEELWDQAEQALRNVLDARGVEYRINEGDGAFYGPKIDFHILDALKRSWQCGTIQLDFQMPEKFDLTYIGEDSLRHRPVVIHRAIYGSIDRFIGILTEHYAGAFPLWLAPVQVKLIPVSDHYADYALQVQKQLRAAGIRVETDLRSEKLGYKIREAQLQKIPYSLVLGEQEKQASSVSVRAYGQGDQGMKHVDALIEEILQTVKNKA